MPNTTTRNVVLCQKYGEDCQPGHRHADQHQDQEDQADDAGVRVTRASGTGSCGITPLSTSCRSRSWQTKIVPQVKRTPMAAASRAISNASGVERVEHRAEHEDHRGHHDAGPRHARLLIFRVNAGACLDMPRLRSTRPVE